ncbi:MAG TPA: hypothetical protein VF850_05755 [Gemmatimonadaceae bacterium]
MGFYEERPPRHGHRTPSELAEDEMLSAVHGDFCGMPEAPETKPIGGLAKKRVERSQDKTFFVEQQIP